jgi:hypothetical protein
MNIPERLTEEGTSPRSSDLTMNLLSILKQGLFQETDCGRWWVRDTTDLCLLWETKIGPGHLWKDKNRPVFGDLSLGFLCWSFCAGPTDVNFTLRPARPRAGSSGHSLLTICTHGYFSFYKVRSGGFASFAWCQLGMFYCIKNLTFDKSVEKGLTDISGSSNIAVVKNIYFRLNSLNMKLATKCKILNTTYIKCMDRFLA